MLRNPLMMKDVHRLSADFALLSPVTGVTRVGGIHIDRVVHQT